MYRNIFVYFLILFNSKLFFCVKKTHKKPFIMFIHQIMFLCVSNKKVTSDKPWYQPLLCLNHHVLMLQFKLWTQAKLHSTCITAFCFSTLLKLLPNYLPKRYNLFPSIKQINLYQTSFWFLTIERVHILRNQCRKHNEWRYITRKQLWQIVKSLNKTQYSFVTKMHFLQQMGQISV